MSTTTHRRPTPTWVVWVATLAGVAVLELGVPAFADAIARALT